MIQWCTIYRKRPSELVRFNSFKFGPELKVGDFEYVTEPMRLGSLKGNRFEIILRDVNKTDESIRLACEEVKFRGFINYFGLQRFGKGGSKSNEIGRHIFKCDWNAVVDMVFTGREGDAEGIAAAKVRC